MIFSKTFKLSILILFCVALISCDKNKDIDTKEKTTPNQATKQELLKERAIGRWGALIESEWTTAYSYQSPSYRKNYTRKEFINSFGTAVGWKSVSFKSINLINDKLAEVTLVLDISFDAGYELVDLPTNIVERWQYTDDNWWFIKK